MNPLFDAKNVVTMNIDVSSLTPAMFYEAHQHVLKLAEQEFDDFVNKCRTGAVKYDMSYFTSPHANHYSTITFILGMITGMRSNNEFEEIEAKINNESSEFFTRVRTNRDVVNSAIEFQKRAEYRDLPLNYKKTVDHIVDDAARNGVLLSDDKKAKLAELYKEIQQVQLQFDSNLRQFDANVNLQLTETEVAGLPDFAKDSIRVNGDTYVATVFNGGIDYVVAYAQDPKVRKRAYDSVLHSGILSNKKKDEHLNNKVLANKIVKLRQQISNLLDYNNHSEFVLSGNRMVDSADTVHNFLDSIADRCLDVARSEYRKMIDFGNTYLGQRSCSTIKFHDRSYIRRLYLVSKLDFDANNMREYFTVDSVFAGLINLISEFFDVEFTPVDGKYEFQKLHPDIRAFEITGAHGKSVLFVDMFARIGKSSGAWFCPMQTRGSNERGSSWYDEHGKIQYVDADAMGTVVCSFNNNGVGLTHSDVTTLFHEFGHALQHLLSMVDGYYSGISGIEWDAVELASQFMEFFCWEPKVINSLAVKPIPSQLMDKLIKSKNFMTAAGLIGHVRYGKLDIITHVTHRDPNEVEDEVFDHYRLYDVIDKRASVSATFSHIFSGGYSAGYYSYLWAEVLAADAYYQIVEAKNSKLFSDEVTKKRLTDYKKCILETGGVDSMNINFRKFAGRDPDSKYLIDFYGIA